jgi:hypothetical protein
MTIIDEQLLMDIRNTELEMGAYDKLQDGFLTLSRLPENIESGQANLHDLYHIRYRDLKTQCFELLEKLLILKDKRGL